MDKQLLLICALAFIIHLMGTLACSVRIAGICTRRIAVSLALFSIFMLLSRTSNSFLGPFLAKRVETGIAHHSAVDLLPLDFRWLLLSATLATLIGAILIPTFQRAFCRAVEHLQLHRSAPKLLHAVFKGVLSYLKTSASRPKPANITGLRAKSGVFASMIDHQRQRHHHDGHLHRPLVSGITDDVIESELEESQFRRAVVCLVGSILAGTVIAQFLFVPSAVVIVLGREDV